MNIYILYIDGVFEAVYKNKTTVAARLGVSGNSVRLQFMRKGFYMKHNIKVVEDTLR